MCNDWIPCDSHITLILQGCFLQNYVTQENPKAQRMHTLTSLCKPLPKEFSQHWVADLSIQDCTDCWMLHTDGGRFLYCSKRKLLSQQFISCFLSSRPNIWTLLIRSLLRSLQLLTQSTRQQTPWIIRATFPIFPFFSSSHCTEDRRLYKKQENESSREFTGHVSALLLELIAWRIEKILYSECYLTRFLHC